MSGYITMKYIDNLTGRQFEIFTGHLLKDLGFHSVKVTKLSGDHGLDVLAKDITGTSIGIQCKHLNSGEYTGYRAIEEAFTGQAFYNTDKSILLTNQKITNNAKKSAKKPNINVTCWDRSNLRNLVTIANNLSHKSHSNIKCQPNSDSEKYNNPKGLNQIFRNDYSLRDAKLLGILSEKMVKNSYPKHINLDIHYLVKSLNLNKENLNEAINELLYVCQKAHFFAFHSTNIINSSTGFINLFSFTPIISKNEIIFDIDDGSTDLLKGEPIADLEDN